MTDAQKLAEQLVRILREEGQPMTSEEVYSRIKEGTPELLKGEIFCESQVRDLFWDLVEDGNATFTESWKIRAL